MYFYKIDKFFGFPLKLSVFIIAAMEVAFALPFILAFPFLAAWEEPIKEYLEISGNQDSLIILVLIKARTFLFFFHLVELCTIVLLFRAVKNSKLLLMHPWMIVNSFYLLVGFVTLCNIAGITSTAGVFGIIAFVYRLYSYLAMASLYEEIIVEMAQKKKLNEFH